MARLFAHFYANTHGDSYADPNSDPHSHRDPVADPQPDAKNAHPSPKRDRDEHALADSFTLSDRLAVAHAFGDDHPNPQPIALRHVHPNPAADCQRYPAAAQPNGYIPPAGRHLNPDADRNAVDPAGYHPAAHQAGANYIWTF